LKLQCSCESGMPLETLSPIFHENHCPTAVVCERRFTSQSSTCHKTRILTPLPFPSSVSIFSSSLALSLRYSAPWPPTTTTATTAVTLDEIKRLYNQFKSIASSRDDDGVIDREEFQQALGLKDSLFVKRMFSLFDSDDNGQIDFKEFICGLSTFCEKATLEEKLRFSFRIYDVDNDGHITKEELYKLLEASLIENSLGLPQKDLQALVDATFREADANGDGMISYDEYKEHVARHPTMIKNMTLHTDFGK